MSRKANMSLWGLYSYNTDLFSGITIPKHNNLPLFYKQDFIDNLLLESEGLEVLYTDPDFMQQAITAWASKQFRVWQELADTLFYEYDPIENYNRVEQWTDEFTHGHTKYTDLTHGHVVDTDLTHGHKVTMDVEDTTTNSVTGYNGATFADKDKSVFKNDDTETHSGTDNTLESHSGKDSTQEMNTGTDENFRKGFARGNIGVTTTQQMIEAQREVVKFNLMDLMIEEFKQRFLLLVY